LGADNFTCFNGWINRFKKGNNTVYLTPIGESRHVDSETAVDRKNDQLLQETKEYDPCDIYCITLIRQVSF
jgi:purine nucleoside phosphorylase